VHIAHVLQRTEGASTEVETEKTRRQEAVVEVEEEGEQRSDRLRFV